MTERYGQERVKRGFLHFMIGKGVSSVAGFLATVLVIRALTIDAFAVYSVLTAFVALLTAISGLGLAHVLLRYVPELYALHYKTALRQLISNALLIRTVALLVATLVAYWFEDKLMPGIGLEGQASAFNVFLLVVLLRSSTHVLSQVLESTLHQSLAQLAFTAASVIRLTGMAYLLHRDQASLLDVIWVEVISDSASFLIGCFGVAQVVRKNTGGSADKRQAPADDANWLHANLRQMARFALAGYVQHLAIMPYGGPTNRLVGGHMLGVGALANFGFAQSLYEYVARYLPAQLLVGLIRPIVVARYCERRDFSVAAKLCGQVLQINILLIGAGLAMLAVGGTEVLAWMSAEKYGAEAATLLAMLLFVLLLETQRQQLELLVQTVEQYRELIASNILLACSVFIAILLIPAWGAIAFPAANLIGLVVANAWVQHRMRTLGYRFRHDWASTMKVALVLVACGLAGLGLKLAGLPWVLSVVTTTALYGVLGYVFCRGIVRAFMNDLLVRPQSTAT